MCGICGIYNYRDGPPADVDVLADMIDALVHRGPDDAGLHVDDRAALGMRRLSIIDLAGGAQPIFNEAGTICVVSNGEIYNFRELRRELAGHGHSFATRSDTEVIVHAYEQWGADAFAHFNGMFGTAVWDATSRQLILARDPFGVKPLYYRDDGDTLVFSSELRSLFRHPGITRDVDVEALYQFLTLTFVPSPGTGFAQINKLLPGQLVTVDRHGLRARQFHRPDPAPLAESEDVVVERLRDGIAQAVRRQMVADVPVGVMLSGGIDSSTLASLMTSLTDEPVKSFTVGFADGFSKNELEPARRAARRAGTEHHELIISAGEFSGFLESSIWHLEELTAAPSAFAFHKVCEMARQHVKVVLTGQGADEPFAGYSRHLGERYGWAYRRLPGFVREGAVGPLVGALPRNEALKRAVRAVGTTDDVARLVRVYSILDEGVRDELLRRVPGEAGENLRGLIAGWHRGAHRLDALGAMLYVDARLSLPDNLLLYGDKMSMATSLEARVPFLDLELMQLAESIPATMKIRGRTQKRILKRAMAAWLPKEVIKRRKIGFATPVDEWFRHELRRAVKDRLLERGSATRVYFRPEVVSRLIDEHERGRHDHKRILFSLLTFEIWHEQFVAAGRRTSAVSAPA
jgi:asparagine synthase (glutamine-hydrolysing)